MNPDVPVSATSSPLVSGKGCGGVCAVPGAAPEDDNVQLVYCPSPRTKTPQESQKSSSSEAGQVSSGLFKPSLHSCFTHTLNASPTLLAAALRISAHSTNSRPGKAPSKVIVSLVHQISIHCKNIIVLVVCAL